MTPESRLMIHKGAAALTAVALLLAGAGATYLLMRRGANGGTPASPGLAGTTPSDPESSGNRVLAPAGPLPDVVVRLSAEAVDRAGIVVATVSSGRSITELRIPGIVEPNAYREVVVTPLVAGRVTRVSAELGARVRRGQSLAQIYSPELAEAQTRYVGAKAMLDAHDRELARTEKLVEIGAASRQELERIHAEHAAQTASLQSARSQLELLGMPASAITALEAGGKVTATTTVPAPIDGAVTERAANVGLNVDPATKLFTIVDLTTVWIVADVYEQDFAQVHVGSVATVTTTAYPGLSQRGRISYIDPQVSAETRTARVRVEVPNPRGQLRLGMYADVVVSGARGTPMPVIPRAATQNVGDRTVVYLADPKEPGRFTEREVRLGDVSGEQVVVTSGIEPGDLIVTEGSFFVRAERERLGMRPAAAMATGAGAVAEPPTATPGVQTAKIVVNEQGFEPSKITLRAGTAARLTFVRTTDSTCGTEVVFPSLNIKRPLPLNEPVQIDFTPATTGDVAFACGMDMLKGSVVVQ